MVNTAVMQLAQTPAGPVPIEGAHQSGQTDGSIFGDLLIASLGNALNAPGDKPAWSGRDAQDPAAPMQVAGPGAAALAAAMIGQLVATPDPSTVLPETTGEPAAPSIVPQRTGPAILPVGLVAVAVTGAATPRIALDAEPETPQPAQAAAWRPDSAAVSDALIEAGLLPEPVVTPAGTMPASVAVTGERVSAEAMPDAPVWLPITDPVPAASVGPTANPEPVANTEPAATPRLEAAPEMQPDSSAPPFAARTKLREVGEASLPREAFLLAPQPAHNAGQPPPTNGVARQFLEVVADSGEAVQAMQGPVQLQDQPADSNGPQAETGDVADATGSLTQAESFHRAVAEASASRTAQPAGPNVELHQRVIDQVVRAVSLHRFQDRTDMVVKLHPPELGALSVRVMQDAQGLTSQIQATSESVRSLLQAHLPLLADALADVGVRLNSVTVTSDASFSAAMHDSTQGSGHQQSDAPPQRFGGTFEAVGVPESFDSPASLLGSAGYSWLA